MVGDGERWKQGVSADFALVSAGQRWWAMIQVLLQLSHRGPPSESGISELDGSNPRHGTLRVRRKRPQKTLPTKYATVVPPSRTSPK